MDSPPTRQPAPTSTGRTAGSAAPTTVTGREGVTGPAVAGRRRSLAALFTGAAAINAAMVTASTTATLVFADAIGGGWGGVPNAAGVAGTAIGVVVLTRLMSRRSRRAGLLLGAAVGTSGAALATAGAATGALWAVLAGMLLLGVGNAGAQLSRYAAADLYPVPRRGFALGAVVWAGTIGAVGGPLLLAPVTHAAHLLGLPPLAGAFGFALGCLLVAGIAATLVVRRPLSATDDAEAAAWPARTLVGLPEVRLALVAMLTAQVVMVGIMTAAPLDLHEHGHGMGMVGLVLSAHTLGMFALAPLSGRLTDAYGGRRVIGAGLATLAGSAVLVVSTSTAGVPGLPLALFLLGYGWNLVMVGASGLLVGGLPAAVQPRAQGMVEAASWGCAALATVASTAALGAAGYAPLAAAAGALVLAPTALLAAQRTAKH
jgi:MFS family permease